MTFEFDPHGVCSRHYTFEINDNDIIESVKIIGGCKGNLTGISKLLVGMNVDFVIDRFEGTDCNGKGTSCPDQISKALKAYKESKQHD